MDRKQEAMSQLEKDLLAATVFISMFVYKIVKDEKTGIEKKEEDFRSFTATAFEREASPC